jgi:hypothetical protein
MMPQSLTVRVERPHGRPIRIWIPVLPVLLVFAPFVVLAALAAAVACRVFHVSMMRAMRTGWRVVFALPGTQVDIAQGRTAVLVAVR